MQIKTFVNAVALALLTAGAHARVPSGTYSIVNRIHSIHGDRRAITFYGEGQELTTQRWIRSNSQQKWVVKDFDDKTQTISPAGEEGDGLQCAPGKGVVTVLPAHDYVWNVTLNEDKTTFTIQDGGKNVYWELGPGRAAFDLVTLGKKTEAGEQSWFFFPA